MAVSGFNLDNLDDAIRRFDTLIDNFEHKKIPRNFLEPEFLKDQFSVDDNNNNENIKTFIPKIVPSADMGDREQYLSQVRENREKSRKMADSTGVDEGQDLLFIDDISPIRASATKKKLPSSIPSDGKEKPKYKRIRNRIPTKKFIKETQIADSPTEPKVAQLSRQHRIRAKRLIVDKTTHLTAEEVNSNLNNTEDLLGTIDLAPHSKRLMLWKETGRVEKLLILPGRQLSSKQLFRTFQSDMRGINTDNYDFDSHDDGEIRKERLPRNGNKRTSEFFQNSSRIKVESSYDEDMEHGNVHTKLENCRRPKDDDPKSKAKAAAFKTDDSLEDLVMKITSQLLAGSNAKVKKESVWSSDELDEGYFRPKKAKIKLEKDTDSEFRKALFEDTSDIDFDFEPSIQFDDNIFMEKLVKPKREEKPMPVIKIHNILGNWRKMDCCNLCGGMYFISKKDLEAHHTAKHSVLDVARQIQCSYSGCKFTTTKIETLKKHIGLNHMKKCTFFKCTFTGYNGEVLKVHIEAMHMKFFCQFCDFRAMQQQDLNIHIMGVHMKYRCNLCDFKSISQDDLDMHIEVVHMKHCSECDFKSTHQFDLDNHFSANHANFHCDACDITFKQKIRLESHIISVHVLADPGSPARIMQGKHLTQQQQQAATKSFNRPKTDLQTKAGIQRTMRCSPELADIIGMNSAPITTCVKELWSYLKRNNLQDPVNGQFFFPDRKMAKIFGKERVKGFTMSKFLKPHLLNMGEYVQGLSSGNLYIKKETVSNFDDGIEVIDNDITFIHDEKEYLDIPSDSNIISTNPLEGYSSADDNLNVYNTIQEGFNEDFQGKWSSEDDGAIITITPKKYIGVSDTDQTPKVIARLKSDRPTTTSNLSEERGASCVMLDSDAGENSDYGEDPLAMPLSKQFGFGERKSEDNREHNDTDHDDDIDFHQKEDDSENSYNPDQSYHGITENEDRVINEYSTNTINTIESIEDTINSIENELESSNEPLKRNKHVFKDSFQGSDKTDVIDVDLSDTLPLL